METTLQTPPPVDTSPDSPLLSVKARIDSGALSLEDAATELGVTPRSLRVRLGKLARGTLKSVDAARQAIGADATPKAMGPKVPDAVEKTLELLTPAAVVALFDGLQNGIFSSTLFLVAPEVQKDKRVRDLLPLSDTERAMLEPWAQYAINALPDALRANPQLGLYLFLGIAGFCSAQRTLAVVAISRELRKEREALAAERKKLERDVNSPEVAKETPRVVRKRS